MTLASLFVSRCDCLAPVVFQGIMSTLNFQLLLCLDGVSVPVVKETLQVIDPYDLGGDPQMNLDLDQNLAVDLVSFKASADVHWLMPSLGLALRWWVLNCTQLPLLQEIKDLIKVKKLPQLPDHLPKQQCSLVLLKVRAIS